MPILPNVTLFTSRSAYSTATGTSAPEPYTQVDAHIGPLQASDWVKLPTGTLEAKYKATIDVGTDVHTGDKINAIVLITDGVTPWPGYNANEAWWIVFVIEGTPGPLSARTAFIGRFLG